MQLTSEPEQLEGDNGDLLATLASIGNVDVQVARRVLRKHKGDMEKAADAILAGDRALDIGWETQHRNTPEPMYTDGLNTEALVVPSSTPLPSTSVIDLTADDDEMTRALQMSMQESSQVVPQFGPSERAPHPEWQMVPSNAAIGTTVTHEDHTLNKAIQASLQDFKEDIDVSPFKESIREGGRPIALRPDVPSLAYAALVLQALYYIPQVRLTVSNLRLPMIEDNTPRGHPDRAMWNLIELFTNMDLAQLAAIVDKELIPSLDILPFQGHTSLAEASSGVHFLTFFFFLVDIFVVVVKNIGALIEQHLQAQVGDDEDTDRLFYFTHGNVSLKHGFPPRAKQNPELGSVVTVEFGGDSIHNDLISCISDHLSKYSNTGSTHDVIIRPSEVIGFQLRRHPPSGIKSSPDPFVYPKIIFLDRFLFDNLELTNEKRRMERKMLDEIKELKAYKETLTRSENKDSLESLRSTIYYYEQVADPGDDPVRKRTLQRTADHLKDIMTMIMGKVEDIDHQVEKLQAEMAHVYDCPELQMYQYDLRAVLLHTGLPGRKQMYSYVQDTEGVWWKTVDHEVTEVPEETVLTDPTGIHLGAGPYMLFYSRHMSDEHLHEPLVWPSLFSEAVEENNKKFLAMMHPELEIFSSARSSPDPTPYQQPVTRELPIPLERRSTASRENSRSMAVDEVELSY
ncbi:hypothetical protein BDZ97DRAFT_1706876 [Flammula alnicola]|nr:hypothetical protein BDZ97DRAFT_1706876 [Flammula alnicola]